LSIQFEIAQAIGKQTKLSREFLQDPEISKFLQLVLLSPEENIKSLLVNKLSEAQGAKVRLSTI
jgi:hypothetical protein